MLFHFAEDGTLTVFQSEKLNQGSVRANKIEILTKLSQTGAMLVGFELPNGQRTPVMPMTHAGTAEGYSLYTFVAPANLLSYPGALVIQAFYTLGDLTEDDGGNIVLDGETLASTKVTVNINRGTASFISTASEEDWNALLAVYQQCRANALVSEGYAVGEQDGETVDEESPYYHNNAKYYAEHAGEASGEVEEYARQAAESATAAEQSATGAENAKAEAESARDEAEEHKIAASSSASAASESAESAAGSASSASESSSQAAESASEAAEYLDEMDEKYAAKQDKKPDGVHDLIEDNKVAMRYIPDALIGQVDFQGTWNALTGVPSETFPESPKKGYYWICTAGGTKTPDGVSSATLDFEVGDWAIILSISGTTLEWGKVDNTDAVMSVNGKKGAVVLTADDIKLPNQDVTIKTKLDSLYEDTEGLRDDLDALGEDVDALETEVAGKSSVSGEYLGLNWTSITIDGVKKDIPAGGGGGGEGTAGDLTIRTEDWTNNTYIAVFDSLGDKDCVIFSPKAKTDMNEIRANHLFVESNGNRVTFTVDTTPTNNISLNWLIAKSTYEPAGLYDGAHLLVSWEESGINSTCSNAITILVTYANCDRVIIADSVTRIANNAFLGHTGLTSITIPDSVTSIGYSAFEGCNGLTSVTIHGSVTSIGYRVFYDCTSLTTVTIENGLTSIGASMFSGCSSLTSITIPDSVTSIGDSAFYGCRSLTRITIPNSVTSIGNYAFYGCTGLTSITIPDSVTSIGDSAFWRCTGLTSVTIGNSVTSIGWGAFSGCTGLTSITYNGTKAQWGAISKGLFWNQNTGAYTIHCTDGDIPKGA